MKSSASLGLVKFARVIVRGVERAAQASRVLDKILSPDEDLTGEHAGGRQRDQSDGLQDGMRPAFSSAMNLSFSTRVGIMEDFLHSSLGGARAGPIGRVYAVTSPAS